MSLSLCTTCSTVTLLVDTIGVVCATCVEHVEHGTPTWPTNMQGSICPCTKTATRALEAHHPVLVSGPRSKYTNNPTCRRRVDLVSVLSTHVRFWLGWSARTPSVVSWKQPVGQPTEAVPRCVRKKEAWEKKAREEEEKEAREEEEKEAREEEEKEAREEEEKEAWEEFWEM
jgi:hypothetical protein